MAQHARYFGSSLQSCRKPVVQVVVLLFLVQATHLANARGDSLHTESPRLEHAQFLGNNLLEVSGHGFKSDDAAREIKWGRGKNCNQGGAVRRLEVDNSGTRAVFELQGDVSEDNDDVIVCVGGKPTGVKVQTM